MSKIKLNLSLCLTKPHAMKTYGGVEMYFHAFLTSALGIGDWSASHTSRFTLGKRTSSTHCVGGWVGPRAGLNVASEGKSPVLCRELYSGLPFRSLHTILTELFRLRDVVCERIM
jgi:hypothetical protein